MRARHSFFLSFFNHEREEPPMPRNANELTDDELCEDQKWAETDELLATVLGQLSSLLSQVATCQRKGAPPDIVLDTLRRLVVHVADAQHAIGMHWLRLLDDAARKRRHATPEPENRP
jgi:hypothetical protein